MSILIDAHISVDYLYGFFGGHGLGWGAGKPYVQLETRRGAPRIKDLEDVDVLRPGTHAEEISLSLAYRYRLDPPRARSTGTFLQISLQTQVKSLNWIARPRGPGLRPPDTAAPPSSCLSLIHI